MKADRLKTLAQLEDIKAQYNEEQSKYKFRVYVCGGAGCVSSNCALIRDTVISETEKVGLKDDVKVYETGCMGTCAVGPVMLVLPDRIFYTELTEQKVKDIVHSHLMNGKVIEKYTFYDNSLEKHVPVIDDINFFKKQVKIALRNCGSIEYADVNAYIANDGYFAAYKAFKELTPQTVVDEVKKSSEGARRRRVKAEARQEVYRV